MEQSVTEEMILDCLSFSLWTGTLWLSLCMCVSAQILFRMSATTTSKPQAESCSQTVAESSQSLSSIYQTVIRPTEHFELSHILGFVDDALTQSRTSQTTNITSGGL